MDFSGLFGSKGEFKLFGKENISFEGVAMFSQAVICEDTKNMCENIACKPSESDDEENLLNERLNDIETSKIMSKPKKPIVLKNESQKHVIQFSEFPTDFSLKETMSIYTANPILKPGFKIYQDELENLLSYYEYPGIMLTKNEQNPDSDYKKSMQCEWILTISDVYNRFLRKNVPYFYVFNKTFCVLFTYTENPIAIMNTSTRSMKLMFDKYLISGNIVLKDLSEIPLQNVEPNVSSLPVTFSQGAMEDFQGNMSSQYIHENSQKMTMLGKPNEGIYKFVGKNVQKLFVFVMNEWQLGEKDVKIIAPTRFLNAMYKIPKITSIPITRNKAKSAENLLPENCIQTNFAGFIAPDKLKSTLQYLLEKSKEKIMEINFSYSKNTVLFNSVHENIIRNPMTKCEISKEFTENGKIMIEEDHCNKD